MVPAPILALTTFVVRPLSLVVLVLAVWLHFWGGIFALQLIVPARVVVLNHNHEQGLISRGDEWISGVVVGAVGRKAAITLVVLPTVLSSYLANALANHPIKEVLVFSTCRL